MTFQVTVSPSGRQFACEADETVLAAAMRAGVGLPYGCKNGACGTCKGKLLAGELDYGAYQQHALALTRSATRAWRCSAARVPHSDLVIEAREIAGIRRIPDPQDAVPGAAIAAADADVAIVTLQLPANERLQYRAGQYIEFMLKDGSRRSYSIANAPHARSSRSSCTSATCRAACSPTTCSAR